MKADAAAQSWRRGGGIRESEYYFFCGGGGIRERNANIVLSAPREIPFVLFVLALDTYRDRFAWLSGHDSLLPFLRQYLYTFLEVEAVFLLRFLPFLQKLP